MTNTHQYDEATINEFTSECIESVHRVMVHLENIIKQTNESDVINSMYREIHSLKGAAQLFGFKQIGELSHAVEASLEPVRNQESIHSGELLDVLFASTDVLEKMIVAVIKKQNQNFDSELQVLIPKLIDVSVKSIGGSMAVSKELPKIQENLSLKDKSEDVAVRDTTVRETTAQSAPQKIVQKPSDADAHTDKAHAHAAAQAGDSEASTIRVAVSLLDTLMTLMGEMVLVRNQVLQYSSHNDDLEFLNLSQRLNVVTSELQGEMMKTRMQPIGNILNKYQRVTRDLAKELGKKINFNISGAETELDKTLLESVKDPLTHIIRNSCDHGIEKPEDRKAQGKSDTGTITVRSYHEGGQVIVEVEDDGKGLHKDKLLAKAIEKGLLTQDKAATLGERDILNLIFAPGFSTAQAVTNVSGRGVGMDVVRTNIERIGGAVEISSQAGVGTKIRLKIPLTLAIVPAMIVCCNENRYAIPQVKLVELVRTSRSSTDNCIEYLQGKPIYRLRGSILPLIDLKSVLNISSKNSEPKGDSDVVNIVVLNAETQYFGLIVDEILDTADIVVKPLSRFLKSLSVYSGATVLGDGSVALILDVLGIAQQQQLLSDRKVRDLNEQSSIDEQIKKQDAQEFLLFKVNSQTKYAVLLGYVHRLEEFKSSAIELSGEQRIVRYRGSVLPIISLNSLLGFADTRETTSDVIPVIVTQKGDYLYGIEVNEILDVLSTESDLDTSMSDRPGILGNLVTDNEVIVIIDPQQILTEVASKLNKDISKSTVLGGTTDTLRVAVANDVDVTNSSSAGAKPVTAGAKAKSGPSAQITPLKILYAEDMAFFRKHVGNALEKVGHKITVAVNGEEALNLLKKSELDTFDVILSDIEMPKMNGFELATAIRADEKWKNVPLIALTTRSESRHVELGLKAGFTMYLEKMNAEELINALSVATKDVRRSA